MLLLSTWLNPPRILFQSFRDENLIFWGFCNVFKSRPKPLENKINEILGSKREDKYLDSFCGSSTKCLFGSFFASIICFRPRETCKVPAEVPGDSRVLRLRHLWFLTSDHLETWLISSGTTSGNYMCFIVSFNFKQHDNTYEILKRHNYIFKKIWHLYVTNFSIHIV